MNNTPSSHHSIPTALVNEHVQENRNHILICRNDKTIPYLTFEIKDNDVYITMHCINSSHTTTETYSSLETKSKQEQRDAAEKKKKCIDHTSEDAVGYCEHERKYLCQRCFTSHNQSFPEHVILSEEDQFVRVHYSCNHHLNFKLSFYCISCGTNICAECKLTTHQTHDMFKVEDLLVNTNVEEWMKTMSWWDKECFNDAIKKYIMTQGKVDAATERSIKVNIVLFDIVKVCLTMFKQYKESYNINLYRNTANIASNFNYHFLKTWFNEHSQNTPNNGNTALNVGDISTWLILNISNIPLPNSSSSSSSSSDTLTSIQLPPQSTQINSTRIKFKDTPLEELTTLELPGYIYSICKLNDSQFAVGCYDRHDIFIVDINTLNILHSLKYHTDIIWRLYVHKKSGYLLSLSDNSGICVWEYSRGKWIKELIGHTGSVRGIVEWNNGDIITACTSGLIKYWSMTEYKCNRTIKNETGWYDLILKDNNKWIAGGNEGIKWYKVDAWSKDDYLNHKKIDGKVVCSLLLVNDQWLSGCNDGNIWIFDANNFELRLEFRGHSYDVNCLILLGNGWVASGGAYSSLKIWDWGWKECKQGIELGGAVCTGWCEWDVNTVICGNYHKKEIKILCRK